MEQARSLRDYIDYIRKVKQIDFGVQLKFGLEVCYSPEHEADIEKLTQRYSFDFLVGSIHFIDGWAFSHLKQRWDKKDYDIDELYERYYALMLLLINSGLFSGVAHPQSLQCFGAYPQKDYRHIYLKIAQALRSKEMYIEENSLFSMVPFYFLINGAIIWIVLMREEKSFESIRAISEKLI